MRLEPCTSLVLKTSLRSTNVVFEHRIVVFSCITIAGFYIFLTQHFPEMLKINFGETCDNKQNNFGLAL